jgi:hypothetical protein
VKIVLKLINAFKSTEENLISVSGTTVLVYVSKRSKRRRSGEDQDRVRRSPCAPVRVKTKFE